MRRHRIWALGILLLVASPAMAAEWGDLNRQVTELYQKGALSEAVPVAKEALAAAEKDYGPARPETALSLNNLAMLYKGLERYEEARPLYERALSISETLVGKDHPDLAVPLNNLAMLHAALGDRKSAENLSLRAINILTKAYGSEHPYVRQAYERYDALKRTVAS